MPAPASPSHSSASHHATGHRHARGRGVRLADYAPLAILIAFALLSAAAKEVHYAGPWSTREWMLDAMGYFLATFALLKFFDLPGFADGFQKYDLLARRVRAYAFVFPFLELGLALGYLARWRPPVVYGATIAIMVFGALGVINALRRHLDVDCACLGTVLRVPLSTVALTEDLGMATMAAVMLWR